MAPAFKHILVTGAAGLIGSLIAERLLNEPDYKVVLTDRFDVSVPAGVKYPENALCLKGDIADDSFTKTLIAAAQPLNAVFLLHGILSVGSEADYDLSLAVNVKSVHNMLLALRLSNPGVRVIYASSQAVYGQPLPKVVTDDVTPTPEGTYGAHKMMTEHFINDMHRKGFIDAFILRFPTLVVRPGGPSRAASSFLSDMIREPLNGNEFTIPLCDRSFRSNMCSPGSVQENLWRVLHLDSACLPPHIRHLNVPGIAVSTQELMDALAKYGGEDKLKLLKEESIPETERILRSWPVDFDLTTPLKLGLVRDKDGDDVVKQYVDSMKK